MLLKLCLPVILVLHQDPEIEMSQIPSFTLSKLVLLCVQCCVCRKRLSCPRCRSELIESVLVVMVPGQKCIKHVDWRMLFHLVYYHL